MLRKARAFVRGAWSQVSIYLPIILMGLMALGTYWLARNTPMFSTPEAARPERHEPDYYMRGFSVKTFDATGRLASEVFGTEARHFPDTDTLEIDKPRIHAYSLRGELTEATALHALSNGDGSEVQLIGDGLHERVEVIRGLNRLSGGVGDFGNSTIRSVFRPSGRASQRIDNRIKIIRTVRLVRKLRGRLHWIGDAHQISDSVVCVADCFS